MLFHCKLFPSSGIYIEDDVRRKKLFCKSCGFEDEHQQKRDPGKKTTYIARVSHAWDLKEFIRHHRRRDNKDSKPLSKVSGRNIAVWEKSCSALLIISNAGKKVDMTWCDNVGNLNTLTCAISDVPRIFMSFDGSAQGNVMEREMLNFSSRNMPGRLWILTFNRPPRANALHVRLWFKIV